jgi:uncharacterized protein (DUF1800 family)
MSVSIQTFFHKAGRLARRYGRLVGEAARWRKRAAAVAALSTGSAALAACGGGGGGGGFGGSSGGTPPPPPPPAHPTASEASRFLIQASFGANDADIAAITAGAYSDWIDAQLAMAPSSGHLAWLDARLVQLRAVNANANLSANQFYESFWVQAATASDQLRQRVKLALSEIFVVSFTMDGEDPRGMASYYDMLGRNAFGNFRQLLDDVTWHPAMGLYLTYMANQKENAATGRLPDQNYAREVMQLMTIGLYLLNSDGTLKTDLLGNSQPTYSQADIAELAKVFTGMSWYHPTPTNSTFFGGGKDAAAYTHPMIAYNSFHSISAKSFLGTTIAASATADTAGDVKTALDALFNHANVAPFICRQLIQRLVTSNPTPAYVGRVAAVFNNNGSGVRGDLGAVVRALLLDSEARTAPAAAAYGKLREPIVRLANWMRAFEVTSASGNWLMGSTALNTSLDEAPLTSPSVFNFFRPGYVPPNTTLGAANKQAPEFQITDEVSTASYINVMQGAIGNGVGTGNDIKSAYAKELALAADAAALVDRVNLLLYAGQMSAGLKTKIVNAVTGIAIPGGTATQTQIDTAKLNRVKLAILLSMASPEYIVQR